MARKVGNRRAVSKPKSRSALGTRVPGTSKTRTRKVKGGTRKTRTSAFANKAKSSESSKRVGIFRGKGGLTRRAATTSTGKVSPGRKSRTTTRGVTRTKNGATSSKRVARTHMKGPAGTGTQRKATAKTRGGLTRTAKVSRTTTGTGANRVTKTRRVITRIKNGRTVKRVVNRVNRGGNVSVQSKVKVSGRGPRSTTPQTHKPIAVHKPSNPGIAYHQALGGGPAKVTKQSSGLKRATRAKKRKRK
jgi:hypothetical protein